MQHHFPALYKVQEEKGIVADEVLLELGISPDMGNMKRTVGVSAECMTRATCLSNNTRIALRRQARYDAHEMKLNAEDIRLSKYRALLQVNRDAEDVLGEPLADRTLEDFAVLSAGQVATLPSPLPAHALYQPTHTIPPTHARYHPPHTPPQPPSR